MHYSDIRDRVWAAADYAPAGSPEGIARTREFINRALNRIALDAPFLFERDIDIYLDPDVLPNDKAAVPDTWRSIPSTLGSNFDPWVIESTWTLASAAALYNRFVNPERPSGWYFECKDPADPTGERILSFRIREVFELIENTTRRIRISFFDLIHTMRQDLPHSRRRRRRYQGLAHHRQAVRTAARGSGDPDHQALRRHQRLRLLPLHHRGGRLPRGLRRFVLGPTHNIYAPDVLAGGGGDDFKHQRGSRVELHRDMVSGIHGRAPRRV